MLSVDAYRLGHGLIDSEHKLLFGLIAELEGKIQEGRGHSVLADVMERLFSYAALHFASEDRLMTATDYPNVADHRAEHELVLAGLRRLEATFQSGVLSAPEEALRFMNSWATDHIPDADRRLADHLWECGNA